MSKIEIKEPLTEDSIMHEPLYDIKVLTERGLITNGYSLPYNPKLVARAAELRQKMTPTDRKPMNYPNPKTQLQALLPYP